jgi:hypothetical protein
MHANLKEHSEPEIRRCALDQTLLSLLFLGLESSLSGTFLQSLLDPPSAESTIAAVTSLEKVGAVKVNRSDKTMQLTPLGQHLAGIPAPPTIGKRKSGITLCDNEESNVWHIFFLSSLFCLSLALVFDLLPLVSDSRNLLISFLSFVQF